MANRNRLENNTAGLDSGSGSGGRASISATTVILAHNSITGNTASWEGGGAYIYDAATVTLTNNTLTGNTAGSDGGGAYIFNATTVILTNNTPAGNTAYTGGGFLLWLRDTETTDTAKLYNNLFWDNVATFNRGADLLISNDGDGDYLPTPVTLLANNFDQSAAGFKITLPITLDPTNLNQIDPLFVDASTGDLHLQPGSPMIDAGYPATTDLPDLDIGGTPRVLGASVDIGAYEYDDGSPLLSLTLAGTGSGMVTSSPLASTAAAIASRPMTSTPWSR